MRKKHLILICSLILISFQNIPAAIADSAKSWNYSDQYISSQVTISQEKNASVEGFTTGDASVTLSFSHLQPKFLGIVDRKQNLKKYNSVLSPNPEYIQVIPDFVGGEGAIFVASITLYISDNPNFDFNKSSTYFQADLEIAMGPSGEVLIDNYLTNVSIRNIGEEIAYQPGFNTYLKDSLSGYTFQLPAFSIESTGALFVQTRTDLYENWYNSDINMQGITSLSFQSTSTSIDVSKSSQEIEKAAEELTQTKPVNKKKSIVCLKGKSSLKIIGKKPKCPTGYKKK